MTSLIEFFINYWDKMGTWGHIIFIIMGLLILGGIINNYIKDIINVIRNIKKFLAKIFNKTNTKSTHPTLPNSKENIIIDVKNIMIMDMSEIKLKFHSLNFGDAKRNRIFELIMYTKINATQKHVIELVKNNDIENISKEEFANLIFKMLHKISNEIDMRLKVELGEEIYNVVIDSPRGMRVWEKQNVEGNIKNIKNFCKLNYLYFNSLRLNLIVSALSVSLMVTFNSMEKRFFNFNGELSEILKRTHWNK